MKKCKTCGLEKELSEFYKDPRYKDGVVKHCKCCSNKKAISHYYKKSKDKEWMEKEKIRAREQYHRLGYKLKNKQSKEQLYNKAIRWNEKFPEKYRAIRLCQYVDSQGMNKHHWNYGEGFEKNVILLSVLQHRAIHRNMIYDHERMMYRKLNGELLDSIESCELYYAEIFKKENLL